MSDSALENDLIFISADHRLIHPSTGFDIIDDVKSLFAFLADPDFAAKHLPTGLALDPSRIAVVGESGGGYAARAAGIYASPKPRTVMLQYGMGGDFLDDYWLAVKDPMSMPWPIKPACREELAEILDTPQQPISYDPFIFHGEVPLFPGQEQSKRVVLLPYLIVAGELLDYVLGEKISSVLRELPYEERLGVIPERLRPAILQCQLDEHFPPTVLLHGEADDVILPGESQLTYDRLKELGVSVELFLLDGAGHGLKDTSYTNETPRPGDKPRIVGGAEEVQNKAFQFVLRALQ